MEQINVHFLIPRAADGLISLFRITVEFLERAHPDAVVNFTRTATCPARSSSPARTRAAASCRARAGSRASSSTSSGAVRHQNHSVPIFRLIEPEAIRHYKPLSRLRFQDPEETIYWHRFPCGTLATFCNAFVPLLDPSSCRAPTTPPPR